MHRALADGKLTCDGGAYPLNHVVFRTRYDAIDAASYDGDLGDQDFQYTWEWFKNVRDLYAFAAQKGRHVLFTADQ